VLVVLGFMHFFNLLVFSKMRKRSLPPPITPPTYPPHLPGAKMNAV